MHERMRIGILAPSDELTGGSNPGYKGIERVTEALANGFVERGHDVTLFAPAGSETAARLVSISEIPVRHMPEAGNTAIRPMLWMQAMAHAVAYIKARKKRFDVLHLNSSYTLQEHIPPMLLELAGVEVPYVTTMHGSLHSPEAIAAYRHGYNGSPLISISEAQLEPAHVHGIDLNVLATIYNGVPLDHFPFSARGGDRLGFIGDISPRKGVDLAIQIARAAGVLFEFAGKIDPINARYYEQYVLPYIDGKQVIFHGEIGERAMEGRPSKSELLSRLLAFMAINRYRVESSRADDDMFLPFAEPGGIAMIEALACGTPVIYTPSGALVETQVDQVTGIMCTDMDNIVEEGVSAVAKVRRISRRACRQHVEQRFTEDIMVDAHEDVLYRIRRRAA